MTDIRPAREDIQHPRISRRERKNNFDERSHRGMITTSVTLDSNLPSKMFARIVLIFIQEREISRVLFQSTLTITASSLRVALRNKFQVLHKVNRAFVKIKSIYQSNYHKLAKTVNRPDRTNFHF